MPDLRALTGRAGAAAPRWRSQSGAAAGGARAGRRQGAPAGRRRGALAVGAAGVRGRRTAPQVDLGTPDVSKPRRTPRDHRSPSPVPSTEPRTSQQDRRRRRRRPSSPRRRRRRPLHPNLPTPDRTAGHRGHPCVELGTPDVGRPARPGATLAVGAAGVRGRRTAPQVNLGTPDVSKPRRTPRDHRSPSPLAPAHEASNVPAGPPAPQAPTFLPTAPHAAPPTSRHPTALPAAPQGSLRPRSLAVRPADAPGGLAVGRPAGARGGARSRGAPGWRSQSGSSRRGPARQGPAGPRRRPTSTSGRPT